MDDFLSIADCSPEELDHLLVLAASLKREWEHRGNPKMLRDKVLALIFQKPSLRTRVSFEMAMRHLGGNALYLSPEEIGLGKRESIADVAGVLSGYVDVLMARVFSHEHLIELAKWSNIPVINGLSDFNHPCQALADAYTLYEHFGRLGGLNLTYVGDGNNVAVSLLFICAKMGINFTVATPDGYMIPDTAMQLGRTIAKGSGSRIRSLSDPASAVAGADVIYTDTWTSMGQEEEAASREAVFPPYQVNADLVALANKSAVVMHCLPAHRGQEITDEVADGPQSIIFQQAHNRLHAQKALLAHILGAA